MQVRSPVGTFPVHITAARIGRGGLTLATTMGAWRSEISLDRRDLPLLAGGVALLAAAYALGRLTARTNQREV
jgi:hypothetical protein